MESPFKQIKQASSGLLRLTEEQINQVLLRLADLAERSVVRLLEANAKDLERMERENPMYDRLLLTEARIKAIAQDIRNVAALPSPLGEVLLQRKLPTGIQLSKVRVPLGVVGIIYEARPNVTFDVFSLCFKTGNACLLKGGSDAAFSNSAIVGLIQQVLKEKEIDPNVVKLLPTDRAATHEMLQAVGQVDIIIPRGSQRLINFVRENAKVPVIETGAGIVHTYLDASADLEKARKIVLNAKTRRPSVCNSLDCALVHEQLLPNLPAIFADLAIKEVKIYADRPAFAALSGHYPAALLAEANEEHFGTEFLSLQMSVKTVADTQAAIHHIAQYSSKHSEAIVAESSEALAAFIQMVDAAAVYANASTAFTDGAQFGLGAEIGISTQKLHARGPMALEELTSYKWIGRGNGQIRE